MSSNSSDTFEHLNRLQILIVDYWALRAANQPIRYSSEGWWADLGSERFHFPLSPCTNAVHFLILVERFKMMLVHGGSSWQASVRVAFRVPGLLEDDIMEEGVNHVLGPTAQLAGMLALATVGLAIYRSDEGPLAALQRDDPKLVARYMLPEITGKRDYLPRFGKS